MPIGVKFLNENELIWKRKGLLWHDFIKNNIYPLTLCVAFGFLAVMRNTTHEVLQESAKAYTFLFNSVKSIGSRRITSKDRIMFYGAKNISEEEVKRTTREALASGGSIKDIQLALAKHPLVKKSYIKRNLAKGRIYIKIVEKNWIGVIFRQDGTVYGIDAGGNTWDLSSHINLINNLVKVHNTTEPEKFVELYSYLKYIKIQHLLQEAKMVSGRRWNIKLRNGLVVKLPASNWHNALKVLLELDKTMHLLGNKNQVHYVDLRVQNKIFIK